MVGMSKRPRCAYKGCPYLAKAGDYCLMHSRMPVPPKKEPRRLEEMGVKALEEVVHAARDLLWEWELRTRRGMSRQAHTSPTAVRLKHAVRRGENTLTEISQKVLTGSPTQ